MAVRMNESDRVRGTRRYRIIIADATRVGATAPRCVYCNTRVSVSSGHALNGMTLDHISPRSRASGPDECALVHEEQNLVTACFSCNERKGNSRPERWLGKRRYALVQAHVAGRELPPIEVGILVSKSKDKQAALEVACAGAGNWEHVIAKLQEMVR